MHCHVQVVQGLMPGRMPGECLGECLGKFLGEFLGECLAWDSLLNTFDGGVDSRHRIMSQ